MIPAALAPHRSFLRFLSARVASTTAQQMLMVALGWQMYELTSSAWDLGLVGFAQFVPALALALVAGQVIDRYQRHRIVAVCLILQTLVALAIGAATLTGVASREWILGLSVLLGAAKAFAEGGLLTDPPPGDDRDPVELRHPSPATATETLDHRKDTDKRP